jgi:hypothetical protein
MQCWSYWNQHGRGRSQQCLVPVSQFSRPTYLLHTIVPVFGLWVSQLSAVHGSKLVYGPQIYLGYLLLHLSQPRSQQLLLHSHYQLLLPTSWSQQLLLWHLLLHPPPPQSWIILPLMPSHLQQCQGHSPPPLWHHLHPNLKLGFVGQPAAMAS